MRIPWFSSSKSASEKSPVEEFEEECEYSNSESEDYVVVNADEDDEGDSFSDDDDSIGRADQGASQPQPEQEAPGYAAGLEDPDRIFVGGLPYYFTEAEIRELLESFGPLRGFDLVKDRETGDSVGYAFCAYQDPSVTDIVCIALTGIKVGDKTLTVRRANRGAIQPETEQECPGSAGGLKGPDGIFVDGLHCYFTEAQIRQLLESFRPLRGFDLVKDRETGNSMGHAFRVYQDPSVTDIACAALNGIRMSDKTLTVRRANQE